MICIHLNAATGEKAKLMCRGTGTVDFYPIHKCDLEEHPLCLPTYIVRDKKYWNSNAQSQRLMPCANCPSKEE